MARPRITRRARPPVDWATRLRWRRTAPFALAAAVVLVALVAVGVAVLRRPAPAPAAAPPTPVVSEDPLKALVSAAIQDAEQAGEVQPALPSAVLYVTPTASATPTLPPPTETPTPTTTPTPTMTPQYVVSEGRLPIVDWEKVSRIRQPLGRAAAAFLEPMDQVYQKRDVNEAPSVAAMVMSFYGVDPETVVPGARKALPLDQESKVALPGKLVEYFTGQKLSAVIYEKVTLEQLQQLITNGIPVVVAQTLLPDDPTPHYRVVRGYSDKRGVVMANDSEFAASVSFSYQEFATMWEPYDGFAMPIFLERQAPVVEAILSDSEAEDKTEEYVDLERKLGEPSPEATPTPEPTSSLDAENANAPRPLDSGETAVGSILGSGGGAFALFRLDVLAPGATWTLTLNYRPDDAIISRAVGFKVYAPDGRLVDQGHNNSGRPGERVLTFRAAQPGSYLVQVYNYSPGLRLDFTFQALANSQAAVPQPAAPQSAAPSDSRPSTANPNATPVPSNPGGPPPSNPGGPPPPPIAPTEAPTAPPPPPPTVAPTPVRPPIRNPTPIRP